MSLNWLRHLDPTLSDQLHDARQSDQIVVMNGLG
jgi:hypothetical protein